MHVIRFTKINSMNMLLNVHTTMRVVVVLMLMSLFQFSSYLKAQTISLNIQKTPLKEAFRLLKKQTGYDFIYMAANTDVTAPVTIEADRIPLEKVLFSFLSPLSLEFEIQDKTVLIKKKTNKEPFNRQQQKGPVITGRVLDGSNRQGIPGASIAVKGTKVSTKTNANGYFTLQVPYANATLVISYLGYQPQQIDLNGRNAIEVILVEDAKALQEVTVVGYTTQKKESVTGAVSTITTKELLQSPSANINNVLAGRLPGLIANQYSGGEPGVDKSEIFIRGKSTYGDQSPIIIVDGVERDMSYLSAEEIETFTILKDAVATAPYGIRGANGVIVVKTKRGQNSERASLTFRASQGLNTPTKLPKMLGSADYALLNNEAKINDALRDGGDVTKLNLFTEDAISKFRRAKGDNSDGLGYNNDYFKYIFGRGLQQEYNLSIRGGNDKARYYILGGYFGQGPNYKHVDLSDYGVTAKFKRYNFRSNIDVEINDKLSVKLDLGARITDRTAPATTAGLLSTLATTQPPFLPITVSPNQNAANKVYELDNQLGMLFGDQIYRYNVLGELTRSGYINEKATDLNGTFSLRYNLDLITEGLYIEGSLSYDATADQWIMRQTPGYEEGYRRYPGYATFVPVAGIDTYMSPGFYEGAYKTGNKYSIDQTLGNKFEKMNPSNRTYYQLKLNYDRTFNTAHEIAGMVLFNRSSQGAYDGDRAGVDYRYQGLTGQFNYNYKRKYLASFNFGFNGSENFARNKRYGFFPAGSIGWVISNEGFMKSTVSWLDQLKIRGSYGLVGSDRLADNARFGYLQTFNKGSGYDFGIQNFNINPGGIREGILANVNLTWEKALKKNIGLDATFLKQRLFIAADYFHEYRYDILTSLSGDDKLGFPAVSGTSTPWLNSGIITNHGVEFEIIWSDHIGKDFKYSLKPNFTFARNKIIFQNEVPRAYPWRQGTGNRLYENFVYIFDHLVADQAEADRLNDSRYQPWGKIGPGDVVYKDLNGDGKIDDLGDRKIMGNPRSPEIQFGLPISLQYRGLDFSILFQGALNTSLMLRDAAVWDFPQFDQDKTGSVKPMHLKRWTPETAATATYPALHIGYNSNNKNPNSSLFLYDAKYLRVKNMEIGYSLPKALTRCINLSSVRIYAQGQNLFTWDKLHDADVDPEIGSGSGYWYPVLRVYNVGLVVTL